MAADRVLIIGGGHNGLITAFYLAKAGLAPLVLERRNVVGGSAETAQATGPLLPQVLKDLELEKQGLQLIEPDIRLFVLHPDGSALRIYRDPVRTAADVARFSAPDAKKYPEFDAVLKRLGAAIAPILSLTPPDIDHLNVDDYFNLAKLGLKFRGLDKKDAYRLLRWGPMPVADFAAEWFENELLRAAIEARGIFGCFAGPWSAGTSVGLLIQAALGTPAFVRGGIGALTQLLAKTATAAGAEIRTGAGVSRIRIVGGQATGVVLESGEEIDAAAVVSNADPRQTFLELIDAGELDPGFLTKIRSYRMSGSAAKVHLTLSGLPSFKASSHPKNDLSGHIQIGFETDYLERAFDSAKYGNFSPQPYMDLTIPSISDPALASGGRHVMSIHVQYAPFHLNRGDWNARREELGDAVVRTLSTYAPDIGNLILNREVLTPLDLETRYGLTSGHLFHGEHALDQLFAFRPVLGWARYRTPVKNLYLCGAGTHPGGGITGGPALNASREIVKDMK